MGSANIATFRRLWPYVRPYRRTLLLGGVCLLLATPCSLFHPLVWKFVVDVVIAENKPQYLLPAIAVMLVVHCTGYALNACRNYLLGTAGQRFIFDLRNAVYENLQNQSMDFFHERRSGDLISRGMSDVDALQDVVINGVDSIVANLLSFVYVAGVIIVLQPTVGALTLTPLILVAVLIHVFNNRVKAIYRHQRQVLGDLTAVLGEKIAGMPVIKAFARDAYEIERFREENRVYLQASERAVRARSVYFPSVMALGFFSNVIMVGLGGWFVLQGRFTLGGLVAYRGYWWQLFSPVQTLARVNEMYQRARAASDRIFALLDTPVTVQDAPDARELPTVRGDLQVDDASFQYHERAPALQGVSFQLGRGDAVGIVGPSGAGKSTLLDLLLRFHDPTSGAIRIDAQDYRELKQCSLRQHFGMVTQEPFLFNDSIAANLRFGRPDASDEAMARAAELANAHSFVQELPDGYDTLIGERGVKLSGGQKQRLCIARAFLADPEILLLDEATSAVEPESETIIQEALNRLMEGRTTVIVSHRLSMVRDADIILVLVDGAIQERGSHDELMARDGWYARMYRMQMGLEAIDPHHL